MTGPRKTDLELKVERLDIKLDAMPGSVSKWLTRDKEALRAMSRDVVTAFYAEREVSS